MIAGRNKLQVINRLAAGIDIGAKSLFVAVDPGCSESAVCEFSTFTDDLHSLAGWLKSCRITTVAMEATGIYWIPLYEVLESKGFEVVLANARHIKNVPGRKSDVMDCQWIQQLHSYGLLSASFRPGPEVVTLRAYVRQRGTLIRYCASHIQHMQKALGQMNILLHQVVSSITGKTGLKIIHAILAGERDPQKLAALRDERCKRSEAEIARALYGNYRPEHLMQLRQAVRSYEFYQNEILECEQAISHQLELIISESDAGNNDDGGYGPSDDLTREEALEKICGVDLTKIEGISQASALTILAEIGTDISRWKSAKHFASWLGLCPGIKKSGGRLISSASRRVSNRAAVALRLSAYCLHRSKSALGGYLRRMKSRIGAPKAITATAHKLARLIYALLKYGQEYVQAGQDAYEKQFQTRKLSALLNNAKSMGFKLIPLEQTTVCSL